MPRPASVWWKLFTKLEDFRLAKCDQCGQVVRRGSEGCTPRQVGNAGMKAHIKAAHLGLFEEIEAGVEAANTTLVLEAQDKKDETVRGTKPLFKLRSQGKRAAWRNLVFPGGLVAETGPARRKRQVDTAIMATIVLDLQPFNQVNRGGFQMLCSVLDPKFTLSSDFYYRGLLAKMYLKGKEKVVASLQEEKPDYVALCMDGWSTHHQGFMGAIANYITPGWQRQSLVLGVLPFPLKHTARNIGDWVVATLNEWDLVDKTEMLVSDTASNQMAVFNRRLVPNLPGHFTPGRCVCHVLQLAIHDCILAKENIKRIITDCRTICTHANLSVNFVRDLNNVQQILDPESSPYLLKQDVKTRWNSSFLMLERFMKLRAALTQMAAMAEFKPHHNKLALITNSDWTIISNIVTVLQVFHEITEQLSHGSACVSEVVPCVFMLATHLDVTGGQEEQGVVQLKADLRKAVLLTDSNRLGDFELIEFYVVATLLDPRWKAKFYRDTGTKTVATAALVRLVQAEMVKLGATQPVVVQVPAAATNPANTSILEQIKKRIRLQSDQEEVVQASTAQSLVEHYLSLPREEYRVLRYWKQYEEEAEEDDIAKKALLRVVRRHLTPPPSSTNVERLFSYAGLVCTDHRASLAGDKVDQIIFLRENAIMANMILEF